MADKLPLVRPLTFEQERPEIERIFRENVTADTEYLTNIARQLQLMNIAYHQAFDKGKTASVMLTC